MRMRTKKWARPELAVCPFYLKKPEENKGKWNQVYPKQQPLWLELGCGKGIFLAQIASEHQDKNFLAIDISSDMLGLTKRNVEKMYAQKGLPIDNVYITWQDIERIKNIIDGEADRFERIFINFCNPWHKPSQYKKRLTHTRQLMNYREFLIDGGEIWFKTDHDELFKHSLRYFAECGFEIIYQTYDLHNSSFAPNYRTEHEEMYSKEGIKIKFLIAKKRELPVTEQTEQI